MIRFCYYSDDDFDRLRQRVRIALSEAPIQDRLKAKVGLVEDIESLIEMAQALTREQLALWEEIKELREALGRDHPLIAGQCPS